MTKDLTPMHMRCFVSQCPSVERLENGDLEIIGKLAPHQERATIGDDEAAVIVSVELLSGVKDLFQTPVGMHSGHLGSEAAMRGYQTRVREWTAECFGDAVDLDRPTRQAQLLEEALECVQAAGLPRETALGLVGLVYSKPAGELNGEIGDIMTSVAAFCTAHEADLHDCAENALARCVAETDRIREKQKAKPFHKKLEALVTAPEPQRKFEPNQTPSAPVESLSGHQDAVQPGCCNICGERLHMGCCNPARPSGQKYTAGAASESLADTVEKLRAVTREHGGCGWSSVEEFQKEMRSDDDEEAQEHPAAPKTSEA